MFSMSGLGTGYPSCGLGLGAPMFYPSMNIWSPPPFIERELLRRAADQAFYLYDPYRKGFLEMNEFYPALSALFQQLNHPSPSYPEALMAFSASDQNRDFRISYFEWIQFVFRLCRLPMI